MRPMVFGRRSMGVVVALIVLWAGTTVGSSCQVSAQGAPGYSAPAAAATQVQLMIKPRK
jgi:hypothetical protein